VTVGGHAAPRCLAHRVWSVVVVVVVRPWSPGRNDRRWWVVEGPPVHWRWFHWLGFRGAAPPVHFYGVM
jgi:hypothetical protein